MATVEAIAAMEVALNKAEIDGFARGYARCLNDLREAFGRMKVPDELVPKRSYVLPGIGLSDADRAEINRLIGNGADRAEIRKTYGLSASQLRGLIRRANKKSGQRSDGGEASPGAKNAGPAPSREEPATERWDIQQLIDYLRKGHTVVRSGLGWIVDSGNVIPTERMIQIANRDRATAGLGSVTLSKS